LPARHRRPTASSMRASHGQARPRPGRSRSRERTSRERNTRPWVSCMTRPIPRRATWGVPPTAYIPLVRHASSRPPSPIALVSDRPTSPEAPGLCLGPVRTHVVRDGTAFLLGLALRAARLETTMDQVRTQDRFQPSSAMEGASAKGMTNRWYALGLLTLVY